MLTIFPKCFILDIWQGSEYAFEFGRPFLSIFKLLCLRKKSGRLFLFIKEAYSRHSTNNYPKPDESSIVDILLGSEYASALLTQVVSNLKV